MACSLVVQLRELARQEEAKAPPLLDNRVSQILRDAANEIERLNLRIRRLEGLA
jgi:hypothetical protein